MDSVYIIIVQKSYHLYRGTCNAYSVYQKCINTLSWDCTIKFICMTSWEEADHTIKASIVSIKIITNKSVSKTYSNRMVVLLPTSD